jgi:hypothetical protein
MNQANQLLGPVAVQAEAVILTNPANGQQVLAFTIRHPAGETTVFLDREQGEIWRGLLDLKIGEMSVLVLPGQAIPPFDSFPVGEDYRHPNGGRP